jgi:hypothetical protein
MATSPKDTEPFHIARIGIAGHLQPSNQPQCGFDGTLPAVIGNSAKLGADHRSRIVIDLPGSWPE